MAGPWPVRLRSRMRAPYSQRSLGLGVARPSEGSSSYSPKMTRAASSDSPILMTDARVSSAPGF